MVSALLPRRKLDGKRSRKPKGNMSFDLESLDSNWGSLPVVAFIVTPAFVTWQS